MNRRGFLGRLAAVAGAMLVPFAVKVETAPKRSAMRYMTDVWNVVTRGRGGKYPTRWIASPALYDAFVRELHGRAPIRYRPTVPHVTNKGWFFDSGCLHPELTFKAAEIVRGIDNHDGAWVFEPMWDLGAGAVHHGSDPLHLNPHLDYANYAMRRRNV